MYIINRMYKITRNFKLVQLNNKNQNIADMLTFMFEQGYKVCQNRLLYFM